MSANGSSLLRAPNAKKMIIQQKMHVFGRCILYSALKWEGMGMRLCWKMKTQACRLYKAWHEKFRLVQGA